MTLPPNEAPTVEGVVERLNRVENALRQPGLMLTHTKATCADHVADAASLLTTMQAERDAARDDLECTRAMYENLEASEILNGYKNRAEAAEAAESDRDALRTRVEEMGKESVRSELFWRTRSADLEKALGEIIARAEPPPGPTDTDQNRIRDLRRIEVIARSALSQEGQG